MNNLDKQIKPVNIKLLGFLFFAVGLVLISIPFTGLAPELMEKAHWFGLGYICLIFGSSMLFHNKISKKMSLAGFIIFFCIPLAFMHTVNFFKPNIKLSIEVFEGIIWVTTFSLFLGCFFGLIFLTHLNITGKSKDKYTSSNT